MRGRHDAKTRFIVHVLWLRGHTEMQCAVMAKLRRKQVAGIIARSPYANRSAMTDAERQTHLDVLRENRFDGDGMIDGGVLRPSQFTILALEREQLRVGTR